MFYLETFPRSLPFDNLIKTNGWNFIKLLCVTGRFILLLLFLCATTEEYRAGVILLS